MSSSHSITAAGGRRESPDPSSYAANLYDRAAGTGVDETDDDAMDLAMNYEPTEAESETLEFFEDLIEGDDSDNNDEDYVEAEEADEDDGEFHDAVEEPRTVQIDFARDSGDIAQEGEIPARAPIQVTRTQLLRLLSRVGGLRRQIGLSVDEEDDEDGIDESYSGVVGRRRRRPRGTKVPFPPVPSQEGKQLMNSGTFGSNEYYQDILRRRKSRLSRRLLYRELGADRRQIIKDNKLMSQGMIPSSMADTIIHYDARCYSGQFSDDGNFFFCCGQDFNVRMYDTSNPYDWKYYKTVNFPSGQWTITDATLSPDNKFLAYSSIRSTVCLALTDLNESSEPWMLDFTDMGGRSARRGHFGYSQFGIWSIRFSGDGREIVAGTGDNCVYVYDIESNKSILRIPGHTDDVNAVCFGDSSSPHILYSGSDDTLIKVWDRRSMAGNREAGVFMGHTEGLTYVDSKGDGRYVLSNGKDQTMKLWDLRKMMSTEKAGGLNPSHYTSGFDYRFMSYSEDDYTPHPYDCSVVTFRGHSVLQTLIRCHFSPPGSTNSRYVYTGSQDGSVYIYNLDATLAGRVDVGKATHHSRPRDRNVYAPTWDTDDPSSRGAWKTCVRDASWHPNAPVIAATSWNGWESSTGTCTIHSWNDGNEEDEAEPKMGRRVDQRLEEKPALYGDRPQNPGRARTRGRRAGVRFDDGDD